MPTGFLPALVIVLALFLSSVSQANPPQALLLPEEQLADPALEAQAHQIGQEIRCLVCGFQSINDSVTPNAQTLRRVIREKLSQGQAPRAIKQELVAIYGPSILLSPPVKASTLALWIAPGILLAIFLGVWIVRIRARPL